VRAGRARPRAARWALAGGLAALAAWAAFGPRGFLPLVAVAAAYVIGPLWTPARYRVDETGVERATAFGRRAIAWSQVAGWRLDGAARSAWLDPKGRGSARFLPPLLLLWEERQGPSFGDALAGRLAARLGPPGARP
jgi:hypothetical protein